MVWINIFFVFLLLFLSGLFSASETAIFSLPEYKFKFISEMGGRGFILKNLLSNPLNLLITILLSNTIVNVGLTIYFKHFNILWEGQYWNFILQAGIISMLIIIFGEVIPKYIGIKKSTFISLLTSPVIIFIKYLFSPIILLFEWIEKAIFTKPKSYFDSKEIQFMVAMAYERDIINKRQWEFAESFFSLRKMNVAEIMIPRSDVYTVSEDEDIMNIIDKLKRYKQRMIPVYRGKKDNIIGIIYVKDLLETWNNGGIKVKKILRSPNFVPDTINLYELLKHFINISAKSSIVVDEFGGFAGIVHIEDIISIFSTSIPGKIKERSFIIDGNTGISEVERRIGITFPQDNFETIAGFIIKMLNKIPENGDKVEYKGYRFIVTEKKRWKVLKVRVEKV